MRSDAVPLCLVHPCDGDDGVGWFLLGVIETNVQQLDFGKFHLFLRTAREKLPNIKHAPLWRFKPDLTILKARNTILTAVTEGGDPQTSFTLDPPGRRRFFLRGGEMILSKISPRRWLSL